MKMNTLDVLAYIVIGVIIGVSIFIYLSNVEGFGGDLKCIISSVDKNTYCVREREKLEEAADLLAKVTEKCKHLVKYVEDHYGDKENVQRLVSGFNPQKVMETLPTSTLTAYSENKGEKIAFCLNKQKENNNVLIDEHTLTFVAIHELSHIASKSIGHKSEFWENFHFLLQCAKEAGIHEPVNYKETPKEYCGMRITDNPYYDM
jgi:hypothetical protein